MRTKASLVEILEELPHTSAGHIRSPRMRQLFRILTEQRVADAELPIFEREILEFKAKSDKQEEKRAAFIRRAAVYLNR